VTACILSKSIIPPFSELDPFRIIYTNSSRILLVSKNVIIQHYHGQRYGIWYFSKHINPSLLNDNELPLIIQYLKKSKTELENKLTAEFIYEMEQVAEDMKKRLVNQIIDDLIALVISLNDKQIEHFDTALKSDIKEHTEASDISEEEWMMVKDDEKTEN
jgi:hypothetical protein